MGSTHRKRIEATHWGKVAKSADARYLHGTVRRRSDGHHRKVARITLGELAVCRRATDIGRCWEGPPAVSRGRRSGTTPVLQRAEPGGADSHACSLLELDRNSGDDRIHERLGWGGTPAGSLEEVYRPTGDTMNETKLAAALSAAVPGNAGYVIRTSGVVGGRRA